MNGEAVWEATNPKHSSNEPGWGLLPLSFKTQQTEFMGTQAWGGAAHFSHH